MPKRTNKKTTKKKTSRRRHMLRFSKVHALVTACFVVVYVGMGLALGPDFLLSDLGHKLRLAGFSVSATVRVWGPPVVPDINLTTGCSGGGSYVFVDWDTDENAESYDVFRNGAELITGLVGSSYNDTNVDDLAEYSYYVIAHGPEGDEASAEESVQTGDCSTPLPDPEIIVTRFENIDLTSFSGTPSTTDRRPEFYGTSNIAHATVRTELNDDPIIISTTQANSNGYWSWTPGSNISIGLHTIYFVLIDPADPSRTDSTSFTFRIIEDDEEEDDEDGEDDGEEDSSVPATTPQSGTQVQKPTTEQLQPLDISSPNLGQGAPIDLALRISEIDTVVVQGTDLSTQVYPGYTMTFEVTVASFQGVETGENPIFAYSILDPNGEEVYRATEQRQVSEGEIFEKKITLPRNLEPGNYKLRIEANVGGYSVSEERWFTVEQSPIVALSSNFKSILAGFISDLGWLVIILILILILILIFAIVEWKIHHHHDGNMDGGLKKKIAH